MKFPGIVSLAFVALSAPTPSIARPPAVGHARINAMCGVDSYRNVNGNCVHRPVHSTSVPVGASAHCRDGTYSFSQHRRGTCSYHGGVAAWL